MPAKKKTTDKELVANAEEMLLQVFRLHAQTRHAQTLRFRSKGEHAADHRLNAERLDHVHEEKADVPGAEQEPSAGPDL